MALIECRECSNLVSSEAAACPRCGCPSKPVKKPESSTPLSSPVVSPRANDAESAQTKSAANVPNQREHAEAPKVLAPESDTPLLRRVGILVTRNLIDLQGRTYSVHQLNTIKVDPTANPRAVGLGCLMVIAVGIGGFMLVLVLMLFAAADQRRDDIRTMEYVLSPLAAILLFTAFMVWSKLQRLPRWALLRFEMSSGKVKALEAEKSEVEAVAAAIRMAMSQR